jgi:thioredoxin-related protein
MVIQLESRSKLKWLFPFLIFFVCENHVLAGGIHFEKDSFSILLRKAVAEKKMIFIDCSTSWCPQCRRMEKNVFPNDTVADFYNSHFVCAYYDAEKGEGMALAKRYEVGCYPTYLFIDENGNLLHRASGEYPVKEFIAIGNEALSPKTQFATIDKKCKTGKATPSEILLDLQVRKATYMAYDTLLDVYMKAQPDSCLSNRENWNLLHTYNPQPWNHMFRYLLSHQQEFSDKFTEDSIRFLINKVYALAMATSLNYLYGVPDTVEYRKLRTDAINLHLSYLESLVCWNDMDYYIIAENQNAFAKTACYCVRNYNNGSGSDVTWKFYEHVTDTAYLDTAISWAARAVSLKPDYFTTKNYAALLYKRGRKQEAKLQATRAISFEDKLLYEDPEQKELLRKIRAMK